LGSPISKLCPTVPLYIQDGCCYLKYKFLLLSHLKLIENGGATHNFESGPPKDHFNSNFWAKDFDVIFISKWNKQAEKNLTDSGSFYMYVITVLRILHTIKEVRHLTENTWHLIMNHWYKAICLRWIGLYDFKDNLSLKYK
jgi:hypothetical protein